jgi:type I restriction enzyme R subunit
MPIIKHHQLTGVCRCILNPAHLGKMIAHYIVINETIKVMMILRPYQYFATEAIIHQVKILTTTLHLAYHRFR